MAGCYYGSFVGIAFGWTQVIPTTVTTILSVMGFATQQVIFPLYGLYLHGTSLVLWIFQTYLQQVRANPVCQLYQTLAFPSTVSYYIASVITFIVLYAYLWDVYISWFKWLLLYALAVMPIILVWVGYNSVVEILISMLIGVIFTSMFVIVLKLYISPLLPFLLNAFPFTYLGYVDSYLMNGKQIVECNRCRISLNTNVVRS